MSFKEEFEKFYAEYERLTKENQDLLEQNEKLRHQAHEQKLEFENILIQTKRSYKAQYRKHVKKYEMKIEDLTERLRRLMRTNSNKENNGNDIVAFHDIRINGKSGSTEVAKTVPTAPLPLLAVPQLKSTPDPKFMEPSSRTTKPVVVMSSPVKSDFDVLPTQYSSEPESQVASATLDADFTPLQELTPLQRKEWLSNYFTSKYYNDPHFRIDLSRNPITQIEWVLNDFETVDEGDDTPPFMFIKDNTSQEDRIKHEQYELRRSDDMKQGNRVMRGKT
ncbi:hypothetical protein PSN45_003328 [Yamadazyma tenuis]|uniref:uncharacterized protein n=1 Tax=Candida tenuis TaxID=2315449 RepID=UPI0027AA390F|nr:hypothetical protein PSN45_003328 [Yamadazyma tenuis]